MRKVITAVAALGVLGGCSHNTLFNQYQAYPEAELPPKVYQQKLQAVAHWKAMAKNEAEELAKTLAGQTVTILPPEGGSPFSLAYEKLLSEALLDNGMSISSSQGYETYTLSYETQVVAWQDRDSQKAAAGLLSMSAAAGYLIYHAVDKWSNPGLVAIPLAVGIDAYIANNKDGVTPDTEVLITTSVRRGDALVDVGNRIYYFNAGDAAMYERTEAEKETLINIIGVTNQP